VNTITKQSERISLQVFLQAQRRNACLRRVYKYFTSGKPA